MITLAPAQNPQRLVPATRQSTHIQLESNYGFDGFRETAGPNVRSQMGRAIASLNPDYSQRYVVFVPRFKPSSVVLIPTVSIASLPSAAQNTPANSIIPTGTAYPSLWDLTA